MLEMGFLRPPLIQILNCRNLSITDLTLKNPPFWTINPVYCDGVTVRGVTIDNPHDSPNTDGINPESSRNVHISDCHINVGDDCITIKSGRDRQGRRIGRPSENITITNCTMLHGHGGVVIGSEMSRRRAPRRDLELRVSGDRARHPHQVDARPRRRRSKTCASATSSCATSSRRRSRSTASTRTCRPEPVSERTPRFRNIRISGVTAHADQAGTLLGLEEARLDDVTLTDIDIVANTGFVIKNANHVTLRSVRIHTATGPQSSPNGATTCACSTSARWRRTRARRRSR